MVRKIRAVGECLWHHETKKVVVSCEKLRGVANKH